MERLFPIVPLVVAGVLLLTLLWRGFGAQRGPAELRLGAGHIGDESFQLGLALGMVTLLHESSVRLVVEETDGSVDSLAQLSTGQLELAMVQADVELPREARMVAVLYADVFVFAVREDGPLWMPEDLAGRTLAVADTGSAQTASLDRVLRHYEIADDVTKVYADDAEADRLLAAGEVDAVFRVRSPHNLDLKTLAHKVELRLMPIPHGPAMAAADPALNVTELPVGAIRGRPAVPAMPLSTLAVDRLLVAHVDAPEVAVRAIAKQLFERRQELVRRTPVAAGIRPPERRVGDLAPLHSGVVAWLQRAEPSYLEANADYVSLLMSTLLLVGSWMWAGRSFVTRGMQRRADNHNRVLVEVLRAIDASPELDTLIEQKGRLLRILEEVLDDVESEAISPAQFQGFALGWEAAHDALRDRERDLRPAPGSSGS